ncbi:MAG: SDR family NAD(P)-dependent oxidoreductase [Candidatus Aminicenantes bacterium]|nr:MAG: SDR family NAD(P)-dependent oxidoreductase [Candidatus Aminicenantes bacterium]
MAKLDFRDKWVLVTGASSGLGRAIALYMAQKENANLVVAARRTKRLEQLKEEIESSGHSKVKIITVDLSEPGGAEYLFKKATEAVDIYAVINNAGITFYGKAEAAHLDEFEKIIAVNLKAVINLSLRFLSWFERKGEGAILNITSEAGLIPTPYQTVYSASKHAAQAFTEGLRLENRKSKVVISSFAPGGIATEMLTKSGLDKKHGLNSPLNMKADKVARLAVKAFKKKKFLSVPGVMNKLILFLVRFFPRKWLAAASELAYRP